MEYLVRNCPKCNGKLHIPSDMEQCICMFCGEKFEVRGMVSVGEKENPADLERDYQSALENIALLLENSDQYLASFTKQNYSASFERYVGIGMQILKPIQVYASFSNEMRKKAVIETANAIVDTAINLIEGNPSDNKKPLKRSVRRENLDRYRFFFAVYIIPMIRYLKLEISEDLVDEILDCWRKTYPKHMFQKGTYEDLQEGFKKKSFFGLTF